VGVRGLLAQVKKSLDWRYRFGDAYILPAKTSVTQLTHRSDEYIKFDYTRALDRQPNALVSAEPALTEPVEPRPSEGRFDPVQAFGLVGTATHLVISQLDLARPVTQKAIEKTKDKLLADNAISPAVAGSIDIGSMLTFFESDLGKKVFAPENTVLREWPFTFALPAWHGHPDRVFWDKMSQPRSHFTSGGSLIPVPSCESKNGDGDGRIRDTIIIQGIIDMLIRTPKGLVIIDFKTDNITAKQVPERAELYRRQLDLYSRAASAILKEKLLARWLYFLSPRVFFEV